MTYSNKYNRTSQFGQLSHVVKDHVYMFGRGGFIYTAPWIAIRGTRPPSAALILSAGLRSFTVTVNGDAVRTRAAVVPSFVLQSLDARDVPLVCFHAMPGSRRHDALNTLAAGDAKPVDRGLFVDMDPQLRALYGGQLAPNRVRHVYDVVLGTLLEKLLPMIELDPRVQHIRDLLEGSPELSLTDLANKLGTSYFSTSRMMSDVFGMSLRDYKASQKLTCVFTLLHSDRTITEIAHTAGFTDSAHLSRTYQRWYGQAPSYSRNSEKVCIVRCG